MQLFPKGGKSINLQVMTADQMMRAEIAKGPTPRRTKLAIAASALGVGVLVAGGIFGVSAANAYRADIQAMQASAEAYYEAAEGQAELAQAAAESAAVSAQSAEDAVTVAEAEQAAATAALEAQVAAEAAAESQDPPRSNLPAGATPPNVPGTDQPDSTACASSALTWDGSKSVCA